MPHQNRVTPDGKIISTKARGAFMGNRGRLHNSQRQIVRQWAGKAWITCLPDFKNRHREIMAPNSYTELFFLDEATAFAAGHRPRGECRRQDFLQFKKMWRNANPGRANGESIKSIDAILHAERVGADRRKKTYRQRVENLPVGAMFSLPGRQNESFLVWNKNILKWSPTGYEISPGADTETEVDVLTPPSIVRMLASVGEWESGRVGEWESGRTGERESGRTGEWVFWRVGGGRDDILPLSPSPSHPVSRSPRLPLTVSIGRVGDSTKAERGENPRRAKHSGGIYFDGSFRMNRFVLIHVHPETVIPGFDPESRGVFHGEKWIPAQKPEPVPDGRQFILN